MARKTPIWKIVEDTIIAGGEQGVRWSEIVEAVKAQHKVKNWLDVRGWLQALRDENRITRTDNVHEERYVAL